MSYTGSSFPIPLGAIGLKTDLPMTSLPPNALIKANNVSLFGGKIEKSRGSLKYNEDPIGEIVSVFDWFPTPQLQRLIAITADGFVYRDTGDTTFTGGTPMNGVTLGSLTPDTHQVSGGSEESGKNKKLFILSDSHQIQVIDGDASVLKDVALPALDWVSGNFPTFGVIYQNRLCVFGCANNRHQLYFSATDDHENFSGQTFPSSSWEVWGLRNSGDVDLTSDIQNGTPQQIFTTTSGEGVLIQGASQFNKVSLTVAQAQTGSPVYQYTYWNGANWISFTPTASPDFSSTGVKNLEFGIPSDWDAGDGTEGGNDSYYSIRIIATTAPSQAVTVNSVTVQNTNAQNNLPTFSVFPGESDGIITAAVYRGLLFLFKKPYGVYVLDGRDPDSSNWTISRYSDAFGVGSPHAITQVLGDLIAANSFGSYTSLQASDTYGDFEAGDILANLQVEEYVRSIFNQNGLPYSQSTYYPEKKRAYFTGQSSSADVRDQMVVVDVNLQPSRITIETKDRPNCLSLRRDVQGILRPMYGTKTGHVFIMDQDNYLVDNAPFVGEFQTAYTDFSFASSELGGKNKIFDFLEINYVPTGNNNFYVDVYVDGQFRQTLTFAQKYGAVLDSFVLDVDRLAGDPAGARNRKPLKSCTGNKISFRVYNNSFNEGFKIERMIVSFRPGDEAVYGFQP